MWATAGIVMMDMKGLTLQWWSPSHKVWRRRKTTHAGVKTPWLLLLPCYCPTVTLRSDGSIMCWDTERNSVKMKRPCCALPKSPHFPEDRPFFWSEASGQKWKLNVAYPTTEKCYHLKVLGDTQYSVWSVRSSDIKKLCLTRILGGGATQHFF